MSKKLLSDHWEALNMNVIRPYYGQKGKIFDTWINHKSPQWQRLGVMQLKRYLSQEELYQPQDLVKYADCWEEIKTEALSITDFITDKNNIERPVLIGYILFHTFRKNPVLDSCYIHPSYRKRGLMKKAWEEAKIRYPKFEVDQPTTAMIHFMATVDCSHVLKST